MVAVALLAGGPASARDAGTPPRALAVGDAVTAVGQGTSGLYFNPATIAQLRQYAIDAGYGYSNFDDVHNIHTAVVDSQTNEYVSLGAAYTWSHSGRDNASFQAHDVRTAIAAGFGTGSVRLAAGGTFRYLHIDGDGISVSACTADLGALVSVGQTFHLGVAGLNLVDWRARYRSGAMVAPRQLAAGAGITWNGLNLEGNATIDFDSRGYTVASPGGGIEYVIMNTVALRAGFVWDRSIPNKEQRRVSGGLGYISRYVGVDVGYSHDVSDVSNWLLQASIRGFLP
jgi:hypothetical protein